jgi:hypothetical protein
MALFPMMMPVGDREAAVARSGARWAWWAQLYGAIIAAGFAFFLAGIPVQVSDSLGNLMAVAAVSWRDLLRDQFSSTAFFRPLLLAQTKALLDASSGHYFVVFRAFQVAQVFACIWLFVRMLRVRTGTDLAAAMTAVAVLTGSHTFAGTIREAYPINNYMTIVLCCLAAVNVQMGERWRWYTDALVLTALVIALGTIETGLLVWGCLFMGYLAGWRGVSRGALALATATVIAYFALRFFVLDVGTPSLAERSSGYGFRRLEPSELQALFGASPYRFYAYNVVSSVATVLFSEPRSGVWTTVRDWRAGEVAPSAWINLLSSTLATVLVAGYAASRRWWQHTVSWTHGQRLVWIAAAVIVANAGISFPYTKDQIMSVGGVFFAAACYAAVAAMLEAPSRRVALRAAAALALATVGTAWSWRVLGVQHNLVHTAFTQRNDWAYTDIWIREHPESQRSPVLAAIVESLRVSALSRRVSNPHSDPSPFEEYFDHQTD